MNKLAGFYELKESMLPTIPWKLYDDHVTFSDDLLWTIRSAVYIGNDLNLPRAVGVDSVKAKELASDISKKVGDNGIVIYYPYFIAEKSGTLNVFTDKVVIEAVKKDLWNLVTYSDRDVTIIIEDEDLVFNGNKDFLTSKEIIEIRKYVPIVKRMFKNELLQGNNLLLEWSYAYNTDINNQTIGDRYLVFYEVRSTWS